MVQTLLRDAGAAQDDIAALVVGAGPGTFTGVRIAVSTGRALALALGRPIFGVSTLDALAAQALASPAAAAWTGPATVDGVVMVPLVDARRRQVFAAGYTPGPDGWVRGAVVAIAPEEATSALGAVSPGARVVLVGADALLEKGGGQHRALTSIQVLDAAHLVLGQELLSGGWQLVAALARACTGVDALESDGTRGVAVRAGEPGSPERVNPIYVRPPDADIHITKMRDPWGGR